MVTEGKTDEINETAHTREIRIGRQEESEPETEKQTETFNRKHLPTKQRHPMVIWL